MLIRLWKQLRSQLRAPAPVRETTPPPPPPDTNARFSRMGQEEIECLYSPQRTYRVVISRDSAGLYRVCRELWDTGDWEVAHVAFWSENERTVTITDSVEN